MKTIILTSLISTLIPVLAACGSPEGLEQQSASSTMGDTTDGDILPGAFKVYLVSRQVPTPSCDVHTILELTNGIAGPVATLRNAVSGPCEIAIDATPRVFNVEEIAGDCGTRRYSSASLQIVDNRARHCENAVGADLIIKEESTSVEERLLTTTFYSFDANY